jgi:hypothetical protein
VVGCTIGAGGKVPGERKPVVRDDDDDDDDETRIITLTTTNMYPLFFTECVTFLRIGQNLCFRTPICQK